MSRLAKKPIKLAQGVIASKSGDFIVLKGPKGELRVIIPESIKIGLKEGEVTIGSLGKATRADRIFSGTIWSLLKNAAQGVSEGFSKVLSVEGVGYRAVLEGRELVLFLGYANPVRFKILDGITVEIEKNLIKISGIDKELVGRTAASIRALKKPEPYKGKGIKYKEEVIKRKVGKRAGATAGATA